jgi:hypothetical protein
VLGPCVDESLINAKNGPAFCSLDANVLDGADGMIQAVKSCNREWPSGQVVSSFSANCYGNDPSIASIAPPSTGDLIEIYVLSNLVQVW